MDYQSLVGRDFCVGEDVYTVHEIAWLADYPLVMATPKGAQEDLPGSRRFPVSQVLQWLLIEEEIELFNPNFLGIAGS